MQRYCLYVRGGCALNCATFVDIYENYVLITDRYNNQVSISNVEWENFVFLTKQNTYSIPTIVKTNLRLTQTELQQLVNIAKNL